MATLALVRSRVWRNWPNSSVFQQFLSYDKSNISKIAKNFRTGDCLLVQRCSRRVAMCSKGLCSASPSRDIPKLFVTICNSAICGNIFLFVSFLDVHWHFWRKLRAYVAFCWGPFSTWQLWKEGFSEAFAVRIGEAVSRIERHGCRNSNMEKKFQYQTIERLERIGDDCE